MKKDAYLIATIKSWNLENAGKFIRGNSGLKIRLIKEKNKLNYAYLKKVNPRYIFFIHWPWNIPEGIYKNFECVVFHMTDLPFGRGGSPLQNLIERGIYKTKISALRADKKIDAGDIYLKKNLSLDGSAQDIFKKASKLIFCSMIPFITENNPTPTPQKGKVVLFKRRNPKQSDIPRFNSLRKVYDYIRMLDAEGYPKAFVETTALRFEFVNARLRKNKIIADARISLKKKKEEDR